MLEIGGGLDLRNESLGAKDRGELRPQHLDGDLAVVFDVVRQIHSRHAAGADLFFDGVAVGEGSFEAFEVIGHGKLNIEYRTSDIQYPILDKES